MDKSDISLEYFKIKQIINKTSEVCQFPITGYSLVDLTRTHVHVKRKDMNRHVRPAVKCMVIKVFSISSRTNLT